MMSLGRKLGGHSSSVRRLVAVDVDDRYWYLATPGSSRGQALGVKVRIHGRSEGAALHDAGALGRELASVLAKEGLRRLPLVMAAPRAQAVLRSLRLPAAPLGELAAMVHLQVERELALDNESALVDFVKLDDAESGGATAEAAEAGAPVLVAVVRKDVIAFYEDLALAAGCRLLRLGLRSFAVRQALAATASADPRQVQALVHLAADETTVEVWAGHDLLFTRSLAGQSGGDPAQDVAMALLAFQSTQHDQPVQQVHVVGEAGRQASCVELIQRQLHLPCSAWCPPAALMTSGRGDGNAAAAIGLVLNHAAGEAGCFDFLHPTRPAVVTDPGRLRRRVLAGAVAAAVVAGIVMCWWSVHSRQRRLDELNRQLAQLKQDNRAVVALRKRADRLSGWLKIERPWLDHLVMLSATLPPAGEAYLTNLVTRGDGALSFTIRATNAQNVTDLAQRLQDLGYQFRPGRITTVSDRHGYTFSAEVRLTVPATLTADLTQLEAPARPADDISARIASEGEDDSRRNRTTTGSGAGGAYRPRPATGGARP